MARVLVVDDDRQVREMLAIHFRRAGYEVQVAENGNEALRLHRESPFQLVVTDIVMPEKEGLETILELQDSPPPVKIIAISGGGRIAPETYLHTAGEFGADRTFAKPVPWKDLHAAVRELLGEDA